MRGFAVKISSDDGNAAETKADPANKYFDPGDGPGAFVNVADPGFELYDNGSTLCASGVGLADGRNERIDFTVATSGIYFLRVHCNSPPSASHSRSR